MALVITHGGRPALLTKYGNAHGIVAIDAFAYSARSSIHHICSQEVMSAALCAPSNSSTSKRICRLGISSTLPYISSHTSDSWGDHLGLTVALCLAYLSSTRYLVHRSVVSTKGLWLYCLLVRMNLGIRFCLYIRYSCTSRVRHVLFSSSLQPTAPHIPSRRHYILRTSRQ